ncbi:unnamed protein product [Amaranthus hypochondriacus]
MEVVQSTEILHDFAPRLRVYKDGRIERLLKTNTVPPSFDPITRVDSKDVAICPGISARIYKPDKTSPEKPKLPILIYFHGGAFCLYSASSSIYQNYLNSLVSESGCIAVSVDYRLAPEYPMPVCYDDSWVATQWVLSHSNRLGPESWLNELADFDRVFLAGDSAGANIVHDIVTRAESTRFSGIAMIHPFFGDGEVNPLWNYLYPDSIGVLDPRLNPTANPIKMRRELIGCDRVLVCVGGKDFLRERGIEYFQVLREGQENGEWKGELEFMESKGRGHVYHLYKPECEEAKQLLKRVAQFISNKSASHFLVSLEI